MKKETSYRIVIGLLCGLFALLYLSEIPAFPRHPENYPIGNENAPFWYESPALYLGWNSLNGLLFMAGIYMACTKKIRLTRIKAYAGVLLLLSICEIRYVYLYL